MPEELLGALCAAYDELALAVLILSINGRILFANLAAKTMLEKSWPIRTVDGHVQVIVPAANTQLGKAIERLRQGGGGTQEHEFCLVRSSVEKSGAIGCLRLLQSMSGGEPAIAFFITETGQKNHYGLDGFAEAYSLSRAESRTLKALVETQTPANAAARLNVALSTVKSHIRKIFQKTNMSRQADLLRLVESCRTPFRRAE
jgi:DNA-binding CsgD family transcriptional regulator